MKKQTYKFREECINDVLQFMEKAKFHYDVKTTRKGAFPDVVVELATRECLNSTTSIFKEISDSHVVLDTIQSKKLYTDERG